MKTSVTTIIFDIGGVLITPSEKITPFILSELFTIPLEHAIEEYQNALPRLRTGSLSVSMLMEDLKKRHILTKDTSMTEALYAALYEKQAVVNENVMAIIQALFERYTTVAFSNMIDLHVRCNRKRQLFQYFHKVYLSSETGLAKPDPAAFQNILLDMGVSADSCVFVDDKKENIEVATSLGFRTCHFDTELQLKGFLQKEGFLK